MEDDIVGDQGKKMCSSQDMRTRETAEFWTFQRRMAQFRVNLVLYGVDKGHANHLEGRLLQSCRPISLCSDCIEIHML